MTFFLSKAFSFLYERIYLFRFFFIVYELVLVTRLTLSSRISRIPLESYLYFFSPPISDKLKQHCIVGDQKPQWLLRRYEIRYSVDYNYDDAKQSVLNANAYSLSEFVRNYYCNRNTPKGDRLSKLERRLFFWCTLKLLASLEYRRNKTRGG